MGMETVIRWMEDDMWRMHATPIDDDSLAVIYTATIDDDIYYTIIDTDGVEVVAPVLIHAGTDFAGKAVAITRLTNNNLFIAYGISSNDQYFCIRDSSGTEVVASTLFGTDGTVRNDNQIDVVTLTNGSVAVAYMKDVGADDNPVFQIFNSSGAVVKAETTVEAVDTEKVWVVALTNGNFVVVYSNTNTNVGRFVIYDSVGDIVKAATTFSSTGDLNRSVSLFPACALTSTGGFAIFWTVDGAGDGKITVSNAAGTVLNDYTVGDQTLRADAIAETGTNILLLYVYASDSYYAVYTTGGVEVIAQTATPESNPADKRYVACRLSGVKVTTAIVQSTDQGAIVTYDIFAPPVPSVYARKLVAVGNNTVFYEDSPGSMVEVATAAGSLDTTKDVAVFGAFQKIFIANDTTFKVLDFGNVKLSTADIGGNIPHIGNILTGENSLAQIVVDFITTDVSPAACLVFGRRLTVATFVNTETVKGVNDAGNNISFDLDADEVLPDPPHYYDWTPYANNTDTYGEMPTRATLGCLYRGRGVLSGHPDYPHQWYMSRQGNLWDWAYIASDAQAPVAGNDANAGEIGDIVTALTPYHDDFLNFGCAGSIWLLSSDPCAGGSIRQISNVTGIWSQTAQCFDEVGNLVFLGAGGVYKIPYEALVAAAAGEFAQNITKFKFPSMIADLNLDLTTHKITMQYDVQRYGVIIGVTTLANGTNTNYWLDLRTEDWGIFPESYPTNAAMYAAYYYNSIDPAYSGLLLGGKDGYIRIFDDSTKNDDTGTGTQAIESHVVMGPQFIGADADKESRLTSLSFTTALNTDNLFYQIFADDTAEEIITAINASPIVPLIAGTLTDYTRPIRIRQGVRGTFVALRIGNDMIDKSWSTEIIVGNVVSAGRK